MEKRLYTTAQTKAIGGFGTTTMYKFINDGVLEAVRMGDRTMITAKSLHALIDGLPRVVTPTMQRRAGEVTEPAASLPPASPSVAKPQPQFRPHAPPRAGRTSRKGPAREPAITP